MPARPAQGVHLLAVAGIGGSLPDQRLSPRHPQAEGPGVQRVAQGGVVSQLLQGPIVAGDARAGAAVPARPRTQVCQFAPALAQQEDLPVPLAPSRATLSPARSQSPSARSSGGSAGAGDTSRASTAAGCRQAHSAQLESRQGPAPPPGSASSRRAMRFSMDLAWRTSFVVMLPPPDGEALALALRRSISFARPPGAGGPAHPRQPAPPWPGCRAGAKLLQLAVRRIRV